MIAVSPDGMTVVGLLHSVGRSSLLSWGAAGGQIYKLPDLRPFAVTFLPDSHTVALQMYNGAALFDLHSRTILRTFDGVADVESTRTMAVAPDGASLAIVYEPTDMGSPADSSAAAVPGDTPSASTKLPRIELWDLAGNASAPRQTISGHADAILAIAFSPDGSRLASASRDSTARVWDTKTGAELLTLKHDSSVESVAFSPDGQRIVTSSDSGIVRLWDGSTGAEIRRFTGDSNGGRAAYIQNAIFSPDGSQIAAMVDDKQVYVWDVAGYEVLQGSWPESDILHLTRFSASGEALVGGNGWLSSLSPAGTGAFSQQAVEGVVFDISQDGQRAAIFRPLDPELSDPRSYDAPLGTIGVWDRAGGGVTMSDTPIPLRAAAISPDGATLVSITDQGMVQIRDSHSAAVLHESGPIISDTEHVFFFSPDRRQVAALESDFSGGNGIGVDTVYYTNLTLWDVASGEQVGAIQRPKYNDVRRLAYSPDGKLIAMGYTDASIEIWRLADLAILRTLALPRGDVTALSFSADGSLLVSGNDEGIVGLWDWMSGEQLHSFDGRGLGLPDDMTSYIYRLALSPDGSRVLAINAKGRGVVWRNDNGKALVDWVRASRYLPELSCDERERYQVPPLCASAP